MIHLHTKSCYSLLESTTRLEQIVEQAKADNQKYAALTDTNTMFGTRRFFSLCEKAGLVPIIGLEVQAEVEEGLPVSLLLLAKNHHGLQNLYALSTIIGLRENKVLSQRELREHMKDVILLTSGIDALMDRFIYEKNGERLAEILEQLSEINPCFYISIALNDSSRQREENRFLKSVANSIGIETVALSRIDYLRPQDEENVRLMQAISHQTSLDDPALQVRKQRFWRNQQQMEELYEKDDLDKTEQIAGLIDWSDPVEKAALPKFKNQFGLDSAEFLKRLCKTGLNKRLNHQVPEEYADRLESELSIILSMGFADYFLIVWDFIRWARRQKILVGPGRGSAAGSLVAWSLGITHINPVKNQLIFERFLNPDRISMPDIDTDFPDDRRDEVIHYVADHYGPHHVAHIVTFSTLKARAALRDAGRALNIPVREIDQLVHALGKDPQITLKDAMNPSTAFHKLVSSRKSFRFLVEKALAIEGLPRHTSMHAGGIVLCAKPIENYAPLIDLQDSVPVVQFTMEHLEELGLIKFDFLGLKNLSILDQMNQLIEAQTGTALDLLHLPLNDPAVYDVLCKGDTLGIFQLESEGIRNLILRFQPRRFEDIAAILALYRPGPMKNISLYLQARRSNGKTASIHPLLDPILQETGGIFLYQEQIMKAAQVLGGFTMAQADTLRKAMSKKNHEVMLSWKEAFIQGAGKKGIDQNKAASIFDTMERFSDYGFNKSHSYAYGLIVYQMAYIKARYPLAFYLSSLNAVMGSSVKTARFLQECRSIQLPVLAPDINESMDEYVAAQQGIIMPLRLIKGISSLVSSSIINERNRRGPFESPYVAIARLKAAGIQESAFLALIQAGAFDCFGYTRTALKNALPALIRYGEMVRVDSDEMLFTYEALSAPKIDQTPDTRLGLLQDEKEVFGFYLQEHPAVSIRRAHPHALPIEELKKRSGYLETAGTIAQVRQITTKKQQQMAFAVLEDEGGQIDLAIMPSDLERLLPVLKPGQIVFVTGRKNRPDSMIVHELIIQ